MIITRTPMRIGSLGGGTDRSRPTATGCWCSPSSGVYIFLSVAAAGTDGRPLPPGKSLLH
jgi:hypothetical protein